MENFEWKKSVLLFNSAFVCRQLFEKMCMMLGGRVAESLTFNNVTSGWLTFV